MNLIEVMMNTPRKPPQRRSGMILLVVLGMLMFFSILAATYLVFANQSREAAFVSSARNTKTPDVRMLLDEALMTLIRGTADPSDPFYGEDLLSDYYGRYDALALRVRFVPNFITCLSPNPMQENPPVQVAFVRFPFRARTGTSWDNEPRVDDLFTGRLITFTEGPLAGRTFRVFRSRFTPADNQPAHHSLYIELPSELVASGLIARLNEANVRSLFYPDQTGDGYAFQMNGVPRNSPGLGFNGENIEHSAILENGLPVGVQSFPLPRALQPNHLGPQTVKMNVNALGMPVAEQGDFDESYDAADYNNWFLGYTEEVERGGNLIPHHTPSFHRPAVLNYILNQPEVLNDFGNLQVRQAALVSLARGTFRPLPLALRDENNDTFVQINPRFTGSNDKYALRTPINVAVPAEPARFRLDQVAKALIGSPEDWNPWDVDNTGDGQPDSIWIDLNLPMIKSREGKLLKPLVAPRIEDFSGRLNVNAHSNYEIPHNLAVGGIQGRGLWANSRQPFDNANNDQRVFRGIGYGPAEITIPAVGNNGTITTATVLTGLAALRSERQQFGGRANANNPPPGRPGYDDLSLLRSGWCPPLHLIDGGYGYSTDPYGRAAVGLGRGGNLLMARSGGATALVPGANELRDNPYELDPTGRLSGDRTFTFDELEPMLRSSAFDLELLPRRLHGRLQRLLEDHPEFTRSLTTASVSDDSPALPFRELNQRQSLLRGLIEFMSGGQGTMSDAQIREFVFEVIAPELRLGRKIDVNRPFGNGVDDNGNQVIDEPGEHSVEIDQGRAFTVHPESGATVPLQYRPNDPNDPSEAEIEIFKPDYGYGTGGDARRLLARHLYCLMMALVRDADLPAQLQVPDPDLYRARRIAQWAVNVVDYRDNDSIMTRFVFDPNPFNGWNVDDDNPNPNPLHVVWGVEQPELVFSEAQATHDVRVRDTNRDVTTNFKGEPEDPEDGEEQDLTTDQVRIPQGSLMLELVNPRPPVEINSEDQRTKQAVPRELYRYADESNPGGLDTLGLDLSLLAPGGMPVWRIALSAPHPDPGDIAPAELPFNPTLNPWQLREMNPHSASFQPEQPDELVGNPPVEERVLLDRFIFFRALNATQLQSIATAVPDIQDQNQIFFAPAAFDFNANGLVMPGQFLTLAPRMTTHFGSFLFSGTEPVRPSGHRLQLIPDEGLIQFDRDSTDMDTLRLTPDLGFAHPAPFAPAKPLVIGTFPPAGGGWNDVLGSDFVGLNVSEPLPGSPNYYPQPTFRYGGEMNANYPLEDAYVDLSGAQNTARRRPLDVDGPRWTRIPRVAVGSDPDGNPEFEPFLGTIPRYCTAFLQRLANPLIPYHPINNPYRTVDAMPIDLTVFSGEERHQVVTDGMVPNRYASRTRQRNGQIMGQQRNSLYSYETSESDAQPINPQTAYFEFPGQGHFHGSWSFLNTSFPIAGGVGVNPNFDGFSRSIGMLEQQAEQVVGFDRNFPAVPYAQHPWLNRPFASHLELMMVPASSAGRLFEEFSMPPPGIDPPTYFRDGAVDQEELMRFFGAYRHLLNFFHGSSQQGAGNVRHAEFSRIFDFVHTLPRFRGEVEMIAPRRIMNINNADNTREWVLQMYSNPFNFRYDNRRQGRVNLNTLGQFPVWAGLMQGHLNDTEYTNRQAPLQQQLSFQRFLSNRRGYTVTPGQQPVGIGDDSFVNYDPNRFDARFPTEFAGVFRSHHDAHLAPQVRGGDVQEQELLRRRGVDGSLLRRRDSQADGMPVDDVPLMVRAFNQQPNVPGDQNVNGNFNQDRVRNPFIRYQTAMRMPNLASDNSQLFGVWLTIGFFEVDSASESLGREYNEELGQNERYQAFFIIDRSRPVGFIPGQNLNARDVVVYEKFYQ